MIAISHLQAKRLIQASADGQPVPQEQWAQMQAHLEGCAYAQELAALENSLRRALSARWASAPDVPSGMVRAITAQLSRSHPPQRLQSILGVAAVLLLAVLIFGPGRLFPAPQPLPRNEITATPTLAPSPTPTPVDYKGFHGVVLYESRQDGNGEIYLLNAAGSSSVAKPVNLTHDPAEDSDPVWSPDGEWIAFLSDRTGKKEVYAMHISGSRLRQITDYPEIEWTGPLDWSPDGQFLALHGTRLLSSFASGGQRPETNLYLLPVGAGGAPLIIEPSQPRSPIHFAPNQPLLAFTWGDEHGSYARMYNLRSAESYNFIPVRGGDFWSTDFSETSFDWAPDSSRLVMVDEGPSKLVDNVFSEIAVTADFTPGIYPSMQGISLLQKAKARPGAYRAVGWTPDLNRLVYLTQDGGDPTCLALHLLTDHPTDKTTIDQAIPGLCVESGIERANWTGKDGWLVVLAHRPGESGSALWAIRPDAGPSAEQSPLQVPEDQIPTQAWEPELIQLTSVGDGTQVSTPHLRPTLHALDLDPQPLGAFSASAIRTDIPPSDAARSTDWLLINRRSGASQSALLEWNPSTSQERELIRDDQLLSCATYSPDRRQIAYVRNEALDSPGSAAIWRNEIWLMDSDGSNARQFTQARPDEKDTASPIVQGMAMDQHFYPCPLYWSPDGGTLAAMYANWPNTYAAILPLDGLPAKYVRTNGQLLGWTPDGARLLLGRSDMGGVGLSKLLTIDPSTVGEQDFNTGVTSILRSSGWANISGLSFSPDGRQMALLVQYTHNTRVTKTELRVLPYDPANPDANLDNIEPSQGKTLLTLQDPVSTSEVRNLRWLPDGSLVFLRSHPVVIEQPSRGELMRYVPATDTLFTLIIFYDYPREIIWSPDGQWALYSTDRSAGLVDLIHAFSAQAGPRPVDLEATDSVDWK